MARPQVNTNLGQPEQTRTVARPTRSAAPVHSLQQSKGAALANALSSINPKLQQFVGDLQQDYREDESNRAYDTLQGMTYEQAQEAVSSGSIRDTESPWFQAAFEKQFGMAHAVRRRREIVDAYNNEFDKHNGDVDAFLAQYAQDDLDRFGGSDFIMSGYREGMSGVLNQVRDDAAEFRSQWTKERTVDNFTEIARSSITSAVEAGDDPMETVRGLYDEHRNALGLSYAEMDARVFDLAREYAANGDVDTVEAILGYEAVGSDGTRVGAFLTRPQYALDSQSILETAKANRGEANRTANTNEITGFRVNASKGGLTSEDYSRLEVLQENGQITQAQRESIIVQNETATASVTASAYVQQQTDSIKLNVLNEVTNGRAYTLQDVEFTDPTGRTHTLKADALVNEAVNDAMNAMAANGATPQEMSAQLASYGVDTTYSVWENAMSNGYLSLSESLATENQNGEAQIPEPAVAGYMVWKGLNDQPRLRDRHVTNSDAASIYRDAEALESVLGIPPEDALLRSASIDRKSRSARANALSRAQIETIVTASSDGWISSGPENAGYVTSQIEEGVRIMVDLGMSPKQAVETSVAAFNDSHTVINGAAINTRNIFVPENFADASQILLGSFAEQTGETPEDLTLIPAHDGSNYWIVAYKGQTAFPVAVQGRSNRFHISQIRQAASDGLMDAVNESISENLVEEMRLQEMQEAIAAGDVSRGGAAAAYTILSTPTN